MSYVSRLSDVQTSTCFGVAFASDSECSGRGLAIQLAPPRPGQQPHCPQDPSVGGLGPWVMAGRGRAQSSAFTRGGLPPGPPGSWKRRCPPSQDVATGGYERLQLDRPLLEPQPLWTAQARAWEGVRIRPQESSSNGLGAMWEREACLSHHKLGTCPLGLPGTCLVGLPCTATAEHP